MSMRVTVAVCSSVFFLSAGAFAQQPAAGAAAPAPAQAAPAPAPTGPGALRMAFIDLQRVAAESTEGKAANAKVQQLTQTKANEIGVKTKQVEANNQKLQQGGAVLSDTARAQLQKENERLNVEIERQQQDAQAEVQEFQQQQLQAFQEKLRPVVDGLIKELGIGLLFSSADAGAIFIDPSLDITAEVIKRFDASGSAPAPATTAKPAAPAPPSTAKPATPSPAGRGGAPPKP